MSKDDSLIIDLPVDEIVLDPSQQNTPAPSVKMDTAKPDAGLNVPVDDIESEAEHVDPASNDEVQKALKERDDAVRERERAVKEASDKARELEEERARRTKTEQDVTNLSDAKLRADWNALISQEQQIEGALAATKRELETARKDLKVAYESGDALAMGYAQERISLAANDLRTLETGKVGIDTEKKGKEREIRAWYEEQANPKPKPTPQPELKPATPEDWIGDVRKQFGSKPADWLNQHKEFVTDPKLNKKLIKFADYFASVEEKPLDSSEFITALNSKFFPQETRVAEEELKEERRTPPVPAKRIVSSAPVSRGGEYYSSRNTDAKKIQLHPHLVRTARSMGITPENYAKNAIQEIRSGKLPKNFLDMDYPHDETV